MNNLDELENVDLSDPILIYQMGKVGSSSVYSSLRHARVSNSIFHVHQLSDDGINRKVKWLTYQHKENNIDKIQDLAYIKKLKQIFETNRTTRQWKIITMTREPIALEISSFFENLHTYSEMICNYNQEPDKQKILSYFQRYFCNTKIKTQVYNIKKNYFLNWFDDELNNVTGIDIYKYDFDHSKGYAIYEKDNIRLLVIRLEDMKRVFSTAMCDYFGINGIQLIEANIGSDKKYGKLYHEVVREISLPRSLTKKIYSSRYVSHFYSKNECLCFIEKWSKKSMYSEILNKIRRSLELLLNRIKQC